MKTLKDICKAIGIAEFVGGTVVCILAYGKLKYHQGSIDACNHIKSELEKIKEELKIEKES